MLVHLKTLGCRLNEAELETWAQAFQNAGHRITKDHASAHLVIINSCAVTIDAARKSRQLIRRMHRANPHAKLVVSGCYATLNEEEASAAMGVDLVVGNQEKGRLVEKVLSELDFNAMPTMAIEAEATPLFSLGRQRAFIKVQDGCRYRCTFCIVTVARGEEASRSIDDIIEEINTLHQQGVQEFVLTGVHLGGYGTDIGTDLTSLIKTILAETDIPRLRLGSLEPWELSDEFFALFANPRLQPHLHLPLQSGSDSVLKRMGRRCKTAEYRQIAQTLRQQNPYFNITTDIIVGFPGETEQEWQNSLTFIDDITFGHIHIFTYSKREGTAAASFADQLPQHVKKQRSQLLHDHAESMKKAFMAQNLQQEYSILWEAQTEEIGQDKKRIYGYTPNYLRAAVELPLHRQLENRILRSKLCAIEEDYLAVKLISEH